MKNVVPFLFFVAFWNLSPAQSSNRTVNILPESSISIHGDAKVTEFTCRFDISQLRSPLEITYDVNNAKILFSQAELVLKNTGFDCGKKSRNKDFRSMVKAKENPEMKLQVEKVSLEGGMKATAVVNVFIAGKENSYSIPIKIVDQSNSVIQIKSNFDINIRDYDLEPIKKMFGLIKVQDNIQINLDLRVRTQGKADQS